MTQPTTKLSPNTITAIAYALAARGLGWEDLMVQLKLTRAQAKAVVFGRKT